MFDDEIQQEKIKPPTKEEMKRFYVSNKDMYSAYVEWYKKIEEAKAGGIEEPPMPEYIGECIMKICQRLAYRWNFIGYSFRNEMVSDAIVKNVHKAKNFDIVRSDNPFSYVTTIAFNEFANRIKKERKETNIKGNLLNEIDMEELFDMSDSSDESLSVQRQYLDFLRENNCFTNDTKKKATLSSDENDSADPFIGLYMEETTEFPEEEISE